MGTKIFTRKYIAEVAKSDLIRVFVIENSTQVTGAFRSTHTYCQSLSSRFEFHLGVQEGCWSTHQIPNCTVHPFKFLEISRSYRLICYLPKLLYNTLKLNRILARHSVKVVHVGDLYNMLGVLVKILNPNIKLIYHVRLRKSSYVNVFYKFWIKLIKKYADAIICVSYAVAKDVGESDKTRVIYDVLPEHWMHKYTPEPLGKGPLKLLYVGNFIPGKGHDHALEVFQRVYNFLPMGLKFIGGDLGKASNRAYLEVLQNKTRELGIDEHVEFAGPSSRVMKEMQTAHLVLNFSESEAFSMVCLEALACRKPVIATKSGGPEEIIRHNENGLLVENKNINKMTQALLLLANNQDLRCRFAQNAHIDFAEKFNLQHKAGQLQQVYS